MTSAIDGRLRMGRGFEEKGLKVREETAIGRSQTSGLLPLLCRVSDAGPSQTQPRAPGPASGSLQGRNPRNGWAPRMLRSSMGIWALRIGDWIGADAPRPAEWRR